MKKLIASILTVATVASMASMSVFAAAEADTTVTADPTASVYNDDKAIIGANESKPDTKLYIDLDLLTTPTGVTNIPTGDMLLDDDMFKVKKDKGDDDTKMIKAISVVEKDVDGAAGRENVIKIELNNDMTDKEFKINPSVTFTAKYDMDAAGAKATGASIVYNSGYKYTVELGTFFVSNTVVTGDNDWKAGTGGSVAKPIKNDDNEITWEDENDTIARLTFEGDSDVNKYYPKLSTKWDNADYAENFADTDAFIRSFVGNPTISATSRPVLELYNPFVNEDGEETVAAEDVVIYEVVDGALVDVTAKFTAGENDDGDSVFTIKTRTLGTYIFSNGAATAAEEAPAEEPTDVKENPGTGRF